MFNHILRLFFDRLRPVPREVLSKEAESEPEITAVVDEAYLRMFGHRRTRWGSGHHFPAAASQAMRRVLVDDERRRRAAKRLLKTYGLNTDKTEVEYARQLDLLALDAAIDHLMQIHPRQARVVEMIFFAGMNQGEIAAALGSDSSTIKRDWHMARAWLRRELAARTINGGFIPSVKARL